MEELDYKTLQIKAKELGMEKVNGVSKENLIEYISANQVPVPKSDEPKENDNVTKKHDENSDDDIKVEIKKILKTSCSNKDNVAITRGFKNYPHIKNYLESNEFKNLSKLDQEELSEWFNNI